MTHWKSRNNFELDFILGDHTAVEVKGRADVSERDVRGLFAVAEEKAFKRLVCVSLSPRPQRAGRIEILPWADFLDALWEGEFTG